MFWVFLVIRKRNANVPERVKAELNMLYKELFRKPKFSSTTFQAFQKVASAVTEGKEKITLEPEKIEASARTHVLKFLLYNGFEFDEKASSKANKTVFVKRKQLPL